MCKALKFLVRISHLIVLCIKNYTLLDLINIIFLQLVITNA